MGGTMRLGLYPAVLAAGHPGRASCTAAPWWRSGTGTGTRSTTPTATRLEQAGLVFSGLSPDGRLVEFAELPRDLHPFFVGTQAHPEFLSRPTRPHPLFSGLIAAALQRAPSAAGAEAATAAAAAERMNIAGTRSRTHGAVAGGLLGRASLRGAGCISGTDRHRSAPRTGIIGRTGGGDASRRRGVLALDERTRVLMIRQYRHPVGRLLWEIPAGLRDVAGEPPPRTAAGASCWRRRATAPRDWQVLVDYFSSPGYQHRTAARLPGPRHWTRPRRRPRLRARERGSVPAGRLAAAGRGGRHGFRRGAAQWPAAAGDLGRAVPARLRRAVDAARAGPSDPEEQRRRRQEGTHHEGRRPPGGQEPRVPGGDHARRRARAVR